MIIFNTNLFGIELYQVIIEKKNLTIPIACNVDKSHIEV